MDSLVSIIIPTFNRRFLLLETLKSIKAQTYKNWECIIIDDGSDDNTEDAVIELSQDDQRFKFFKRPPHFPKGASGSRNFGFQKSTGNFVQWLDDDDLLSENKLENQIDLFKTLNVPNAIITCEWDMYWEGKKKETSCLIKGDDILYPKDFYKELVRNGTFMPIHSFLIPREVVLKAGDWNVNLVINDDAEYFTRILGNSSFLVAAPHCYVLYREHQGERISNRKKPEDLEALLLSLQIMQAYCIFFRINNKRYFRWRLLKTFLHYWKTERTLLKNYRYFFKENGININYAHYYFVKHSVYTKIYPHYKRWRSRRLNDKVE